ncbi:hypothetical protein [Pseudoxanthomonas sacheonensis]|uniref:EcsC family protein n=1 Tax=Pseudoxanthomonas sacheonensis TaxID=443615 RepID=A0ABU1RRY9_9GAMM|nr:hypothetical protein [Pseudoxanthomonas sacheonensis]MDR6841548.1 hypothetical protein [Pseudoxanthomonas sacheonensis]
MKLISAVQPDADDVRRHIVDLRSAHPKLTRGELAEKWADRICWRYASEGAATALPGAIPGIGTGVMVAVEATAISTDLAYMFRCMAGMAIGIGIIYDRDVNASFNQDFVRVLGLWCGVLTLGKETAARLATKVAIAQFKKVPAKIFSKINQKVGTTIVTKYGAKRGGVAVGRLIPFGVGALVGGGFNLATMKGFKRAAIKYYATDGAVLYEK